jgi:hypothetical protein
MKTPDLAFQSVGVAGFEPTASSSRTAGKAVDRGCFRTSQATGGRSGAVLVDLVAVFRSCTAAGRVQVGDLPCTVGADQVGPGFVPDEQVRSGGAPAPD